MRKFQSERQKQDVYQDTEQLGCNTRVLSDRAGQLGERLNRMEDWARQMIEYRATAHVVAFSEQEAEHKEKCDLKQEVKKEYGEDKHEGESDVKVEVADHNKPSFQPEVKKEVKHEG